MPGGFVMRRVLLILLVSFSFTLINAVGNHEPDFTDWDVSTRSQILSHEMRIAYKGDIKLSGNLSSIRYISKDAVIYIAEVEGFSRTEILVKGTTDNEHSMDVWVNGNRVNILERQEENISRLITLAATEYGLGGIHHMNNLYRNDGMEAVTDYLNQIHASSILVYLTKGLLDEKTLSREDEISLIYTMELIRSSSTLRDMLLFLHKLVPEGDDYNKALMEVAGSIRSSSNKRDVLMALTKRLTDNAEVITSFFDATSSIPSSSDKRDVLLKAVKSIPKTSFAYKTHLSSTSTIKSSSDKRDVLMQIARSTPTKESYEEFFSVTSIVASSSNKRDVLMVSAKEFEINEDNINAFLKAAVSIPSSADLRDVMMILLRSHKLSPKSLVKYFDASKTIKSKSDRTDVVELGVQFMRREGETYTGNPELNIAAGDALLGVL